ncbi:DUF1707 SHOCT-like domain-containing protein [Nonomuraea jiangxiensis]|uniref:DUF1707 domain-containing protein n=1 Tax=Nonomuraea jiangxiensis TaxID=633440 RepID=A0A1G8C0V7_9ACTN|nr:DUF1707 domain-containing protein [Nonomuraea jiangxiensis]SDH38953.1 protein of unknown function [Nonomuraea jiangxiensis]
MTGVATAARSRGNEEQGVDRDELRIGDAEREQTMAALREHFAQGRLTHEELDERLDQTLAAKTARDLAKVTFDLPGHGPQAHPAEHPGPLPPYDRDAWRAAMKAHRQQMQSVRDAQREMRRNWAHHPHWGHRHPRGGHPSPVLPMLFLLMMVGLLFGGFGAFKVLLVVWLLALIFSVARNRHRRR